MRQRREDRTKGLIAGNVLLLAIFAACVDLQHHQNPHLLRNFGIAEIACITCYVVNAFLAMAGSVVASSVAILIDQKTLSLYRCGSS